MSHHKPKQHRYFGMTLVQILILLFLGLIVCLLFAILLLFVRSNSLLPTQNAQVPTNKPTLVQPTKAIQPTITPIPTTTPQVEILPGPAIRYVPVNTDRMPADYRSGDIENYTAEDGDYYKIKFVSVQTSGVNMESPQIFFSSYVGKTVTDAEEKQIQTKLEFESKANWSYVWSDSTFVSVSFIDKAIQYVGYHSFGQFAEVGRLIQARNVSVLISISVQNENGITDSDITKLQQELDGWTEVVIDKFNN
jgi:hypothetical protein